MELKAYNLESFEEYDFLGCNAVYFTECLTFRRNIVPPSSGSKSKRSKKPTEAGVKVGLAYFLILKMEAICFSELHGVTTQKISVRTSSPTLESFAVRLCMWMYESGSRP
jgi:hypothetical protein